MINFDCYLLIWQFFFKFANLQILTGCQYIPLYGSCSIVIVAMATITMRVVVAIVTVAMVRDMLLLE